MAESKEKHIPPRLELFSDAVFAIIITIMVLELHPPKGSQLIDLYPLLPLFLSYTISFLFLIIFWHNHHHLLQTMSKPTARIMWTNSLFLFWASLVPFSTAWLGGHLGESVPTLIYSLVFLLSAFSYYLVQMAIISEEGKDSVLAKALGDDIKGKISIVSYILATAMALINPWISMLLFLVVALIWILPDPRIEKHLFLKRAKSK